MRGLDDLATPAVLVDLDVLERNIAGMAERARRAGVGLRPHVKTHKSVEIARRQRAAGAVGLTVAKTSEAEVFAASGFDDIFIAYPVVGADKARRLLELHRRVRLAVGVDSAEGAASLAPTFRIAGQRLRVRLKVDVGLHRVGVAPERALAAAREIAALRGLELSGVFTHAGQAYAESDPGALVALGRHEARAVVGVAKRLREAGLAVDDVSVGSTPTAPHAMVVPGVTECRPGNYVFHDASQVSLGSCRLADCALSVLATVVSVSGDRAVVDAGSKTLSSDPLRPGGVGHGWLLGRSGRIERLSEEHGVIRVGDDERLRVGERVRILPSHSCLVSNLHERLVGVRGDEVETDLAVSARGCVQ
jgi:D-serine deaminase-like pyridoxal phosphate-dependent protein